MSIHFESLADGADSNLDSAGADALALTTVAMADMFGECSEEFNSMCGGGVGKHGVHVMEGCDES